MTQPDVFTRVFQSDPTSAAALVFTDPDEIEKRAKSRDVAAWELLLGSMQLRRAGQSSPANDWLNRASRMPIKDDVFRAELLGEAGQGLYESDRLQDAFEILNSAEATWRDVCEQAAHACRDSKPEEAAEFASHLLPLFAAAKIKPPATKAAIQSGKQAVPMVQRWLAERAVPSRAQTANTFIRLLCKAGRIDDARKICKEEMEWIARNFTSPAKPVTALALSKREMSRAARTALYLLLLAEGEVELAGGEFEKSADGFGKAASIFEGKVEDHNDINRLLQAKANQANSLLRLHRIKEALDIYELCEHGFNSLGDRAAAQRVAHAKLFARTLESDDDES